MSRLRLEPNAPAARASSVAPFSRQASVLHTVSLTDEADIDGFRRHARRLLAMGAAPDEVEWFTPDTAAHDLFATPSGDQPHDDPGLSAGDDATTSDGSGTPPLRLPAGFVALCGQVIPHSDPGRHALLYRLAWRLARRPALWQDTLDADRLRAEHLAQAVRRDMHKTKAFVRFRPIADGGAEPLHVAWFEPEHHIVEAIAPFFTRRYTQMRWALLTPRRCARWAGQGLELLPGVSKDRAPGADAGEALWLTYYESIFNPARLKLKMMQKEMPRRYWRNLPEAPLISGLIARSAERMGQMIEAPASVPARRIVPLSGPASGAVSRGALASSTPTTLADLNRSLAACRACPLADQATQAVPGEGPPQARLMLVGEQPGDDEDLRGRPFVGPAGQLLNRALHELGWPRDELYLTNAVKHYKFELRGKRRIHKTAAQQEALACAGWLEHEIALVRPGAIVALGATAARALLGRPVPVMRERGQWHLRADGHRVLVALHPAALLRLPPGEHAPAFEAWLADLLLAAPWAHAETTGPLDAHQPKTA